jgi:DNA-binding transcriptional LysR family regulator
MKGQTHYRELQYFEAVRRWGSIREAARNLDVAASAINRQILKLEADIGLKLFERLPEGMKLSSAGEIYARHAMNVLQDEQRLAGDFDALRGLRRGKISVVAAESLNSGFLPGLIRHMAETYPHVALSLRIAGSNDVPAALKAGDADVGLAFSLEAQPELHRAAAGRFRLGAVMRPDHKLASHKEISVATCALHRLVLPSREISVYTLLESQLRRLRGRLDVCAEVNSMELMRTLTVELNAISFQSRLGLEAELAHGRLVFVPLSGAGALHTELGAFVRMGRALPAAVEIFLARVREEIAARERQEEAA